MFRRLPIRGRLVMLCAGAVALAIVGASVLAWSLTRHTLRAQVEASISVRPQLSVVRDERGGEASGDPVELPGLPLRLCSETALPPPEDIDGPAPQVQLIRPDGEVCSPGRERALFPPSDAERQVAESGSGEVLRDATTRDGERVRVLTRPVDGDMAIQTVRSLEEVNSALRRLAWMLALACLLGVALAAAAGLAVARTVLRPVDRLTAAAEHVAETEELDVPLGLAERTSSRDEVARLTRAFNAMMTRLSGSRRRQQQLVADASHELRTPLTSLRTNIEWLMRSGERERPLTEGERRRIELAVLGQVDELGDLIAELAELARDQPRAERAPVAVDEVLLQAVERAQRRDPTRRFEVDVEPHRVLGNALGLERAVLNLLDNALKFSDGPISVTLREGRVAVSDRGPGLSADARTAAFERFWRSPEARELPGSGLGLSIVAEVAERHGGTAFFDDRPGGGSEVGFTLSGS